MYVYPAGTHWNSRGSPRHEAGGGNGIFPGTLCDMRDLKMASKPARCQGNTSWYYFTYLLSTVLFLLSQGQVDF